MQIFSRSAEDGAPVIDIRKALAVANALLLDPDELFTTFVRS